MRCSIGLAVALFACGGDDDGGGGGSGGSVSGPIGGRTITIADAISSNTDYNVGNSVLHYGTVVMGEPSALCDLAATHTPPAGEIVVSIVASMLDTSSGNYVSTLPSVGTYTVNAQIGNVAFVSVRTDGSCNSEKIQATTGTVTLTTASTSSGLYAGTFDVMLESGDLITGTFDPTACTALVAPQLSCTP